jgi:hypothetical protein
LLLLAAYDRDASSPDALTDLAGVLAGLGYANEALAFLDELQRRNDGDPVRSFTIGHPPMLCSASHPISQRHSPLTRLTAESSARRSRNQMKRI